MRGPQGTRQTSGRNLGIRPASPRFGVYYDMHAVYVIQNDVTKEKYISYTSDLKARIVSHNGGGKKATTRTDGVWKYIYIELFRSREDAQERKLKAHGSAKQKLLLRLRKSLL